MRYVDVILPLPLESTFTYAIDDEAATQCRPGMRVLVPFGKSLTYAALVVALHDERPDLPDDKIKTVLSVMDKQPMVLEHQLKLWQWMAQYYMCSVGEVFKAALPSGLKAEQGYRPKTETHVALARKFRSLQALRAAFAMVSRSQKQEQLLATYLQLSHWDEQWGDEGNLSERGEQGHEQNKEVARGNEERMQQLKEELCPEGIKEISREELLNVTHGTTSFLAQLHKKGIIDLYDKEVGRLNNAGTYQPEKAKELNEAQLSAMHQLKEAWAHHPVVLLHGVTSSGKTEVYIHLIIDALSKGQQVLYLLPEIALTVQTTQRLQKVFGSRLCIYHSKYSDAERVEMWQRQLSDHPYDIVLGARSAVFLPFQRLGLVIVDEEHEQSYKQQDPAPRYHARSVAIMLANRFKARTLLGTATPSAESWQNAQTGKYGLVKMMTRYRGLQLPEVEVVDVKDLRRRKIMTGFFSPNLLGSIREAVEQQRQAIIFQNRRGFAPMLQCNTCGWVPKCRNCDVSLSFHKRLNALVCHICGFTLPIPDRCPACDSPVISDRGIGTEKVEDELRAIFPEARIARMDLDTTRTRNAQERIINDFTRGKTDILIGTQMISKGLDFDRVSVVGILDADTMLNYPDFRAFEHAFMMMAQVAGRAGRHGQRGRVILQTRQPELPVIGQVVRMDYESFYGDLLEERLDFHYPPFSRLIYIYLRHKDDNMVEMAAQELGNHLRRAFGERVLGPDKPPVARIKQMSLRKIVIKLELGANLSATRQTIIALRNRMLDDRSYKALQIYCDVDPE